MAGYKELREGWSLKRGGSLSGTRIFIDYSGGTATLPEIGDPFDGTYTGLLCSNITEELYAYDGSDGKKYTCEYAVGSVTAPPLEYVDPVDDDNLIVSAGTEIVAADANSTWYWHLKEDVDGDGAVQQKIYKNIVRGSISKTLSMSTASYTSFKTTHIIPKLGKINEAALSVSKWYYAYPIGTVLFTGTNERLAVDELGVRVWEVTLNFAYRILDVGARINVPYSWCYLINNTKDDLDPEWQMPAITPGVPGIPTDLLYKQANLDNMW